MNHVPTYGRTHPVCIGVGVVGSAACLRAFASDCAGLTYCRICVALCWCLTSASEMLDLLFRPVKKSQQDNYN